MQSDMTHTRLIFLIVLLSVLAALALMLPGWFEDPRKLAIGEWQEQNKLGFVEVDETSARWRGSNFKGTFHYTWLQYENEPYSVEISRKGEKYLASVTFEDDDHALVNFHVYDRLPAEARKFISQKNKAKNRPEDEILLRFRRVKAEK